MKDRLRLFGLDPIPKSLNEAMALQKKLSSQIVLKDIAYNFCYIAGVDVSYKGNLARASVVLFSYKELNLIEYSTAESKVDFPYVPGFLSFREIPPILKAFEKLNKKPDVIFCDGQGIAHPQKMGIAAHLGILLKIPTIGIAKSRLVGIYKKPKNEKGAWEPLLYKGDVVGAVLRTRENVKPLFVSPGYGVSVNTTVKIVMHTVKKYKTPEPIRFAHRLTRGELNGGL